ncbi:MAG: hypothetical protein APU95_04135 [Hadesarchaea archaeon YNP_N21]|nr:MAG: hypothetical protein APU95_04135 [Hadesarchaea archaeon YNP_N21]
MNAFDLLDERIRAALKEFGLDRPTRPQELAIPVILKGKNLLLIAPTGTGKTEAALLPVFSMFLAEGRQQRIRILYIAPLRALNRDILARLTRLGDILGIRIEVRHGDTTQTQRQRQAKSPPDMLITTPETLQAILPGKKMREHLKGVRWVIVDEVHELAGDKRGVQLAVGLERLVELAGDFQRIGLSATVGEKEKIGKFLAGSNREIEIVDTSMVKKIQLIVESPMSTEEDARTAENLMVEPMTVARLKCVRELLNKNASTLIFVNTREMAEILGSRFKILDPNLAISVHHGSLSRDVRIEAEEGFKRGSFKGLICTSSMELGIDVGTVDLVIQYMSPRQVTRLTQRVGRSGHQVEGISRGVILAASPDDVAESAIIAKRSLLNELEPVKIHIGALDVLAHQLAGLALDMEKVELKKAMEILSRSLPYGELSKDDLIKVLYHLHYHGLIYFKDDFFERRKRTREYYFTNLSTIPDAKRYAILNIVSRKFVGSLDEEFVATYGEPGTNFICKGETWQIVSLDEERGHVLVRPVEDSLGAIPAWEGELIPVPFEIAQELGRLRDHVSKRILCGETIDKIAKDLSSLYPMSEKSSTWFVEQIDAHLKEGATIPTDCRVVIEIFDKFAILHACFGTLVNETLARVLAALLTSRFGSSVSIKVDPYRIAFKIPTFSDPKILEQTIRELSPEHIEPVLLISLKETPLFTWRMLQVAKRFGAIRRDSDLTHLNLKRMLRAFEGTPVFDETMREIMHEKLDVKKAKEIISKIQSGKIEITTITRKISEGPTVLGFPIVDELAGGELILPKRAEQEILKVLKNRLLGTQVRLYCMNCHNWSTLTRVERLPEFPTCGKCEARFLALLPTEKREILKIIKRKNSGKKLSKTESEIYERVLKTANLILTYGKKAIVTLAGRGIGVKTATRILAQHHENEDDYFRAILQAEHTYFRTRPFWSEKGK